MHRNFIITILTSLFFYQGCQNSFSQGVDNIWLMGYDTWAPLPWGGVRWDFVINPVAISFQNIKMCFRKTDASISDKNGNLIFYTNGIWIANSTNDTMLNGSGINIGYLATQYQTKGLPIAQGAFIVPKPADSSDYYIIHETINNSLLNKPTELMYSYIDMNLDGGLGGVVSKNTVIFSDTLTSYEITGSKHGNGRDWWVLTHKQDSDLFFITLVTPAGISPNILQNIGVNRLSATQAAFSPDGSKYACYNTIDDLEIFDFDRCTGLLSNHINVSINDSMVGGGVAFSPSGRFLYASSVKYVYQFDLSAANVAASMQTVAVWDGTYSPNPPFAATFYLMQLAKDGKIYLSCTNGTLVMHVINYPDSAGLACDFQQHSINLPAYNAFSIPNYPNYFLGRNIGSPCDSLTGISSYNNTVIPLTINPNPANILFNINFQLPYGASGVVTIYDTMGKLIEKRGIYSYFDYLQIDCSHFRAGIYFVLVEGKGISGAAKVVVMK